MTKRTSLVEDRKGTSSPSRTLLGNVQTADFGCGGVHTRGTYRKLRFVQRADFPLNLAFCQICVFTVAYTGKLPGVPRAFHGY
jgi:hypothetical protein